MKLIEALRASKALGESLVADDLIMVLGDLEGAVEEFLDQVNDYDEWNADKETWIESPDGKPEIYHEPAITVAKLQGMLGVER